MSVANRRVAPRATEVEISVVYAAAVPFREHLKLDRDFFTRPFAVAARPHHAPSRTGGVD